MESEYQLTLPAQTLNNATPAGCVVLEKAKAQVGFIPNMYARMVNLPGLLNTYLDGYTTFRQEAGFTPPEQELVFIVISRENGCEYCVAAHSTLADKLSGLDPAITEAIRDDRPISDPKLAALASFTTKMMNARGRPSHGDVNTFLSAGYTEQHILGIVLAISVKILSNYSNHLFHTPLDDMFRPRCWQPGKLVA